MLYEVNGETHGFLWLLIFCLHCVDGSCFFFRYQLLSMSGCNSNSLLVMKIFMSHWNRTKYITV